MMHRKDSKSWSDEEQGRLRHLYLTTPVNEIAALLGRTDNAVRSRAKKLGLLSALHLKRQLWSAEEQEYLRKQYADRKTDELAKALNRSISKIYAKANELGLNKSEIYVRKHARLQPGHSLGRATQFPKGHTPANKGLRRPGWSVGRMSETQFKKGERSGIAVKLWKPIGAERISKDGYLERKINNDLPLQSRWRAVHIIMWEQANVRPLPPGHALAFKNGDKADIRLDNLELITRAELMRRNTIHTLPPELKEVIQMKGRLKKLITDKEKRNAKEQTGRPAQSSVRDDRATKG